MSFKIKKNSERSRKTLHHTQESPLKTSESPSRNPSKITEKTVLEIPVKGERRAETTIGNKRYRDVKPKTIFLDVNNLDVNKMIGHT